MKFFISFLFAVSQALTGFTQNANDDYADRIALTIPDSQTHSTKDIATYIKNHFDKDDKKVRAIYTWVASNIAYNADSIRPLIFEEERDQKIAGALNRRKGVCENYAQIFNDICIKSGLRSLVVEGYTKQNGSIDRSAHAWCTVYINNNWLLYDPTWDEELAHRGSFPGNINYDYYQVSPDVFIQSHMPFDPMFQMLEHPVTYREFNSGIEADHKRPYFNYADSIDGFEKSNFLNRYVAEAARIEKSGIRNTMVTNKFNKLKMDIEIIYQDRDTTLYNSAIADYNKALAGLNTFINYRNSRFIPAKTDVEVKAIFDSIEINIKNADLKLADVNDSKANLTLNTNVLQQALDNLSAKAKDQQLFLRDYLGSAKVQSK